MPSFPLYFNILRLHASNCNLLDIYYSLYYKLNGEEGISLKKELSRRISLREKFKLELHNCLNANFIGNKKTVLDKISIIYFPWLSRLEYVIQNLFSITDWEKCYNCEHDNVNKYYKILYSQMLGPSLTDLLLEQKSKVEGYLLSEM